MPNPTHPNGRQRQDDVATEPMAMDGPHSRLDVAEEKAKVFLKAHYGNPESGEVYGEASDYESEAEQILDEKAAGNQAIWIIGAFFVLAAVGYWVLT